MFQQKNSNPMGFQSSSNNHEKSRTLVVVLHGWMGSPDKMKDVVNAVREACHEKSGLDFYVPSLPYKSFLSSTPATEIVNQLLDGMDVICNNSERYSRIILIGFSLGACFARRLFLEATDIAGDVRDPAIKNSGPRNWAYKVERIISLGGLNRGWHSSGRLGWIESFITNSISLLGGIRYSAKKPTIFDARRGAPFIVQTRLQWLALRRSRKNKPEPLVIQLLGTQDNLVAPDDAVDFVDREAQSPYFCIELPHARHDNSIVFSPSRFDPKGTHGARRKARFIEVLKGDKGALEDIQIRADHLADSLPAVPDLSVEHVVFVIHGIRDDGYWTRKVAQKIQECAALQNNRSAWRSVTSSYGYFAMLPFLLPWIRRQKVEWLMDEYVGARARFPNAEFSCVGHSNGTYLIARALQDYPAARFRNILFAGSVVRRDYRWNAFLSTNRVNKVLNMVATHDWVVALFPQGLEPLRRFLDLGGAGFGGFNRVGQVENLHEVRFVIGGHSAGLVETQWQRIAEFIVRGEIPEPNDPDYTEKQSTFWKGISKISTVLLGGLVAFAISIPIFILGSIFSSETTATEAATHMLLTLLYLIGLRFVVMRV